VAGAPGGVEYQEREASVTGYQTDFRHGSRWLNG